MQREVRWDGDFASCADHSLGNWAGRGVPQGWLFRPGSERGTPAPMVAVGQEGMAAHDSLPGVADLREAERPLADVLLIAEDLLLQARGLADSGAPREAVEEILEYVAALREGRS